jgi:hypothetical protein
VSAFLITGKTLPQQSRTVSLWFNPWGMARGAQRARAVMVQESMLMIGNSATPESVFYLS